jgi:hypothetical protein
MVPVSLSRKELTVPKLKGLPKRSKAKRSYVLLEPKPLSKAEKQAGWCLADPQPRWVVVEQETKDFWLGSPLGNPQCPDLQYSKFAWQESPLLRRCVSALQQTWSTIGYDALSAGGENPETNVFSAEDVRDMVSSCGFLGGYPESYGHDKEAVTWLEHQPDTLQDHILALAFPDGRRYGL